MIHDLITEEVELQLHAISAKPLLLYDIVLLGRADQNASSVAEAHPDWDYRDKGERVGVECALLEAVVKAPIVCFGGNALPQQDLLYGKVNCSGLGRAAHNLLENTHTCATQLHF